MCKKRIEWIDVAKFFGIFAIYLGHFKEQVGLSYPFVFTFHVPMFFLISGCIENFNKEENFIKYVLKKIKSILLPFFVFSIISIIIRAFQQNASLDSVRAMIVLLLKGNIRNTFFAASLWFLSCLFVMGIVFQLIKKIKWKPIILLVCLALFIVAQKVINPSPIVVPHWIYNVDSMLYYIIYYAIGYISFPYIENLFKLKTMINKIVFAISGIGSFVYSALLFFEKDLLNTFYNIRYIGLFMPIIKALIVIWFFFIISKILENSKFLNEFGRNTLYLCGSEFIVKTLLPCCISILGMQINIPNPLVGYMYTFVLLIIANVYLVPIEKKIISEIQQLYSSFFHSIKNEMEAS